MITVSEETKNSKAFTAQRITLLLLTAISISLIMSSLLSQISQRENFAVGEVAGRSVVAPRDFLLEDEKSTKLKREEASTAVRPVFRWNNDVNTRSVLKDFFQAVKNFSDDDSVSSKITITPKGRADLEQQYRLDFVGEEWNLLSEPDKWVELQNVVKTLVDPILKKGVVANRSGIETILAKAEGTLLLSSDASEQIINSADSFVEYGQATNSVSEKLSELEEQRGAVFVAVVQKLASIVLRPTVFFDQAAFEQRVKSARDNVEPIYFRIQRGEIIIRAGEIVTPTQNAKIARLLEVQKTSTPLWAIFSNIIIAVFVITCATAFAESAWGFVPRLRDLSLIAITLVGSFALLQLFLMLSESYSLSSPDAGPMILVYAAPLAMGGVLLQVILGIPAVFVFTISFSLISAVLLGGGIHLPLLIVLGNFIGALSIKRCPRRSAFLTAGLYVAITNCLVVACLLFLEPGTSATTVSWCFLFAILGGVSSGGIALFLAPLTEYFGSYITDAKLLELSSLDAISQPDFLSEIRLFFM